MTEPPGELLTVGRVGRPHGLDGCFHVLDAVPGLLHVGAELLLDDDPARIEARKGTAEQPIVRLSLASDRDAAAALRGRALRVARTAAPPLPEGEYWAADLEGCELWAGERPLGRVERMVAYPSCEVLVAGELLVPLVSDAVRSIDLRGRRIEVDAAFLGL